MSMKKSTRYNECKNEILRKIGIFSELNDTKSEIHKDCANFTEKSPPPE